jgi:hypothetical protein
MLVWRGLKDWLNRTVWDMNDVDMEPVAMIPGSAMR